ncbi:Ran-binding protein 1b [Sesamum angolense]|uniref:Ran-binding protein 1b n=1 Tax=Sesamum angolense TaxID=2727404 RepID=A0AAE2BXC9_9LAMI|nr:Ran-binding protein 1b [Sesamum angolense]
MATTTEPTTLRREEEEEEEEDSKPSAEDEDTGAQVAPIVKLQEVAVTTGEENEDVLLDFIANVKFLSSVGNQSCTDLTRKLTNGRRGELGLKLLKHKESGKVRLVMRQSKTLKICANHLVLPTMMVQEHQGNDKSCVWHAADFADGELKEETFCIRFASVENCKAFKDKIEEITESEANDSGENQEATAAASLIEKLSVEGDKPEAKEAPLSSEEKRMTMRNWKNLPIRRIKAFAVLVWLFWLTRVEAWVIQVSTSLKFQDDGCLGAASGVGAQRVYEQRLSIRIQVGVRENRPEI